MNERGPVYAAHADPFLSRSNPKYANRLGWHGFEELQSMTLRLVSLSTLGNLNVGFIDFYYLSHDRTSSANQYTENV